MTTVGATEARSPLAELLDRVSEGETIVIMRRGLPIASLVPVDQKESKLTRSEILDGMGAPRRRVKRGKMTVREMVEEGRRL